MNTEVIMRIGEIAQQLNITLSTVRYYTSIGLLSPIQRRENGHREYGPHELKRMRFILDAKRIGFSINDISQILAVQDIKNVVYPSTTDLLEQWMSNSEWAKK
jgi:DNA-binding transcriptional MerR regulator